MCRMTDYGARWRKAITLPDFGATARWWAINYNGEVRYIPEPSYDFEGCRRWLKPLYVVRVTARTV